MKSINKLNQSTFKVKIKLLIKMSKNSNASRKPFCKVCFDAGKMESEYTNHNVKKYNVLTAKMDTVCPTLNATECRYCYKLGHTTKFCPVLEEKKKNETSRMRENRPTQVRPTEKASESKKPTNVFAALYDSDDEKEEKVATPVIATTNVDDFPSLSKMGSLSSINSVRSYSCVAAIPADLSEIARIRTERLKMAAKPEPKSVKWVDANDESDSDESVYEEEEVVVVASTYPTSSGWDDDSW